MVFKVKKSEKIQELINNINNQAKAYKERNKENLNNYMEEGIEQSKNEIIEKIRKLNFFKEIELFDFKEVKITLNFDNFKLNTIFTIYEFYKD